MAQNRGVFCSSRFSYYFVKSFSEYLVSHQLKVDLTWSFRDGSAVQNPSANTRDSALIPGSGRFPEEANGHPLQYSCLGNPMDGEAWLATVHGVSKVLDTT